MQELHDPVRTSGSAPSATARPTASAKRMLTVAAAEAVSRKDPPRSIFSTLTEMPRRRTSSTAPASTRRFGPWLEPWRSSPAWYGTWIRQTSIAVLLRNVWRRAVALGPRARCRAGGHATNRGP
jgi:hypothetical protein